MTLRWLVLGLGLTFLGGACAPAPETEAQGEEAQTEAVAAQGAEERVETVAGEDVERDTVYVDVRSREEFAGGHVEGAINIPHTELDARHEELSEYADDQIVLYCRSGRRAGIAERILESEGYDHVRNAGGLRDLARQGVPTTR